MRKKILICGTSTVHTYNFHSLVADSFDDSLIVSDSFDGKYQNIKHSIVNFSLRNPWKILRSIRQMKRIVADYQPDIIHIQQLGTHAWLMMRAIKGMDIPVVATAWGSDVLINPERSIILNLLLKSVLRSATVFTADSLYVASRMKQLAGYDIPVYPANFGINIEPQETNKENIIYSNRAHKLLYRVSEIITAFAKFLNTSNQTDWRLIIAGEGEETEKLRVLAETLGIIEQVDFVGWVDKKNNSQYYYRSRLFVSIPESDATSISLLEAMEAGCIPVVSNLPANMEWILDGINGHIVQNLSDDFISEALSIEYERAVEINRQLIATKGSRDANREIFNNLYKKIMLK